MRSSYVAFTAFFLTFSSIWPILGANNDKVFYGIGSDSSGKFLAAVDGLPPGNGGSLKYAGQQWFDQRYLYGQWIQGFLTAINLLTDASHQIQVDVPGIDLWVRNYCRVHPIATLSDAVSALTAAIPR